MNNKKKIEALEDLRDVLLKHKLYVEVDSAGHGSISISELDTGDVLMSTMGSDFLFASTVAENVLKLKGGQNG